MEYLAIGVCIVVTLLILITIFLPSIESQVEDRNSIDLKKVDYPKISSFTTYNAKKDLASKPRREKMSRSLIKDDDDFSSAISTISTNDYNTHSSSHGYSSSHFGGSHGGHDVGGSCGGSDGGGGCD